MRDPVEVGTILIPASVVWLTRKPVGVVPRSAVGPHPGALACRVSRTDPRHRVGLWEDSPNSGVLLGAVDACVIAAERLARGAPSRPGADVWYVSEGRGRWPRRRTNTTVIALAIVRKRARVGA